MPCAASRACSSSSRGRSSIAAWGPTGTLYQVHAYGPDGKGGLVADKTIADSDAMTGVEGQADGEPTHFSGKTPAEVRKRVDAMKK